MLKIEELSRELMQVADKYKVRCVCIIVDDDAETLHSSSNMEGDESIALIKSLANNFTVLSKDEISLKSDKPKIDLSNPNIN